MNESQEEHKKYHYLTEEDKAYIREMYADHMAKEIAARLDCKVTAVWRYASRAGLHKSRDFIVAQAKATIAVTGKKYQFHKGQEPPTKGKKMPPDVYEKCKRTFFKKGCLPHNTKYDGAESIRTENTGRKYRWIRIRQGYWRPKHVLIWEEAHGPIQPGMVVYFKDGDSLNCSLDNLELIPRPELARRNGISSLPEELQQIYHLKARLSREINKQKKNGNS